MGGRAKWRSPARSRARGAKPGRPQGGEKIPVQSMAQRGANGSKGKVAAVVVDDVTEAAMIPYAQTKVLPGSMVYTGQWNAYRNLEKLGYTHLRVRHDKGVYVSGDAHTNTIEGFWSHLKGGVSGVYHGVSTKHLQSY